VFTIVMALAVIGFIVWWLIDERERRRPYLPLILIGGLISSLLEPTLDNMVLFGWPHNVLWRSLEGNGHYFPAYLPMGYVWFDGGLVYLMFRLFERGLTSRQIWTIALGFVVIDIPVNAAGHWFHFNGFYGPQPMEIFGYPFWWFGADAVLIVLGGAMLYRLIPLLKGGSLIALVAFPGVNQAAAAAAVLWPVVWALHADVPQPVRWICGAASLAIAGGLIWIVTKFAATPSGERVVAPDLQMSSDESGHGQLSSGYRTPA
jgi:hypothetical protein